MAQRRPIASPDPTDPHVSIIEASSSPVTSVAFPFTLSAPLLRSISAAFFTIPRLRAINSSRRSSVLYRFKHASCFSIDCYGPFPDFDSTLRHSPPSQLPYTPLWDTHTHTNTHTGLRSLLPHPHHAVLRRVRFFHSVLVTFAERTYTFTLGHEF